MKCNAENKSLLLYNLWVATEGIAGLFSTTCVMWNDGANALQME